MNLVILSQKDVYTLDAFYRTNQHLNSNHPQCHWHRPHLDLHFGTSLTKNGQVLTKLRPFAQNFIFVHLSIGSDWIPRRTQLPARMDIGYLKTIFCVKLFNKTHLIMSGTSYRKCRTPHFFPVYSA